MGAFEVSRSETIQADPARVHALVDDFHLGDERRLKMDKLVGRDFEKGLTRLKAAAEA